MGAPGGDTSGNIQVAVRIRPLLKHEAGTKSCVAAQDQQLSIGSGELKKTFTFDAVFPATIKQETLFQSQVVPLIDAVLQGFNATILAYGQTGAGKTHTILGPADAILESSSDDAGVIPRAVHHLFDKLGKLKKSIPGYDYEVRVQFLELYGEEIRDLQRQTVQKKEKLTIRDVGNSEPEVLGAIDHKVDHAVEALEALATGILRRVTASTAMNQTSSRSHCIFSITVDQMVAQGKKETSKRAKFHFVDLAGAERQKRTGAEGQRMKEGIDINKGLLVLGNVISALGDPKKKKAFVPYRDSKLTRLLKGSLGGNHKTLMIACCSPSSANLEESLNCLRYANRAKNIQNKAVQNVDPTTKKVMELNEKVKMLATDLLNVLKGHALQSFTPEVLCQLAGKDVKEASNIKTTPVSPVPTAPEPAAPEQKPEVPATPCTEISNEAEVPEATEKEDEVAVDLAEKEKEEQSPPNEPEKIHQESGAETTEEVSPATKEVSKDGPEEEKKEEAKETPGRNQNVDLNSIADTTNHSESTNQHPEKEIKRVRRKLEKANDRIHEMQDREENLLLKLSMYLEEINELRDQVDKAKHLQPSPVGLTHSRSMSSDNDSVQSGGLGFRRALANNDGNDNGNPDSNPPQSNLFGRIRRRVGDRLNSAQNGGILDRNSTRSIRSFATRSRSGGSVGYDSDDYDDDDDDDDDEFASSDDDDLCAKYDIDDNKSSLSKELDDQSVGKASIGSRIFNRVKRRLATPHHPNGVSAEATIPEQDAIEHDLQLGAKDDTETSEIDYAKSNASSLSLLGRMLKRMTALENETRDEVRGENPDRIRTWEEEKSEDLMNSTSSLMSMESEKETLGQSNIVSKSLDECGCAYVTLICPNEGIKIVVDVGGCRKGHLESSYDL